jgi:hypothetical protein
MSWLRPGNRRKRRLWTGGRWAHLAKYDLNHVEDQPGLRRALLRRCLSRLAENVRAAKAGGSDA